MDTIIGFAIIVGFSLLVIIIAVMLSRKAKSTDQFFVGNREFGMWTGACSSAAAWTWAPALFVSSQIAYTRGLPGVFWFTLPNALALVLFAFLAKKVRSVMEEGYTLPEYIKYRFGERNQMLYSIVILVVQCYSVIVQLLGSSLLLNLLTGIPKPFIIITLAIVFLLIASFRGIRSSVAVDIIKVFMILFVCILLIPFVISLSGGFSTIVAGLGGFEGRFRNLLDSSVAWSYGIPISISLLAGVTVDQQQWQRAFAIKKDKIKSSFILGGVIFLIIPVMLSSLGFIASNPSFDIIVNDPQLAGTAVITKYLPSVGVVIFAVMVLAALMSAGSAALCAVSSITVVDLYKQYVNKSSNDKQVLTIARITMLVVLMLGVTVALIPNISILYLQLLVGAFRATLLIPTILTLFWKRLARKTAFWSVIISMLIGVPVFVYGSLIGNTNISTTGTLISLFLSGIICVVGSLLQKEDTNNELESSAI